MAVLTPPVALLGCYRRAFYFVLVPVFLRSYQMNRVAGNVPLSQLKLSVAVFASALSHQC